MYIIISYRETDVLLLNTSNYFWINLIVVSKHCFTDVCVDIVTGALQLYCFISSTGVQCLLAGQSTELIHFSKKAFFIYSDVPNMLL